MTARSVRMERLRWRIARVLNWLPSQCWAENASWAMWATRDRDDRPWWRPWNREGESCRADAARTGCCWCGKFQDESVPVADPWTAEAEQ